MNCNQRIMELLQAVATPFSADYVLQECRNLEAEFPHIPSQFKWTLDYKRFQVELNRGNMAAAIKHLKSAIVLAPYNQEILGDYKVLFASKTSPFRNVMLLISCKKYEQKALQLARQFDAANIEYLIVSGNDTPPITHARALQVDAPDNYESLPLKVVAALTWITENMGTNVGVLKVDDDQTLFDPVRLRTITDRLYDADAYAGVPVSGVTHDRNWHWNKCQNKALNKISYGRPYLRAWAMGGAYYLAPGPLNKLVISLTRFPGLLESEYYEDKLVGDTLVMENVELTELSAYEDFGLSLTEQHRFNN